MIVELLKKIESVIARHKGCNEAEIRVIEYHGVGEYDVLVKYSQSDREYLCYVQKTPLNVWFPKSDFEQIPEDLSEVQIYLSEWENVPL